jgi:hypothetical protein
MTRHGFLVFLVMWLCGTPLLHAGLGSSIMKGLSKFVGKEGVETSVEKLAKGVTDEVSDRIATRLLKEGGQQAVDKAAEMTAKHGPDVIRALDNTTQPSVILKALDDLPIQSDVGLAASKLAAGETGQELAELTAKFGSRMLSAEIKHPGLAKGYASSLGDDGIDLCLKLNQKQAIDIGRHLDDIANLPPDMRAKLLALADKNPEGFAKYAREFVEKNPGKVLFTAAATTLFVSRPETLLGGPDNADGTSNPGFIQRVFSWIFDRTLRPILKVALWIGVPFLALFAVLKLYKVWRMDSQEIESKASASNRDGSR